MAKPINETNHSLPWRQYMYYVVVIINMQHLQGYWTKQNTNCYNQPTLVSTSLPTSCCLQMSLYMKKTQQNYINTHYLFVVQRIRSRQLATIPVGGQHLTGLVNKKVPQIFKSCMSNTKVYRNAMMFQLFFESSHLPWILVHHVLWRSLEMHEELIRVKGDKCHGAYWLPHLFNDYHLHYNQSSQNL